MIQAKEVGVTRSSQHGFTKGILCLTRLIVFYDKMIEYVDGQRGGYVQYLDFSNILDFFSL